MPKGKKNQRASNLTHASPPPAHIIQFKANLHIIIPLSQKQILKAKNTMHYFRKTLCQF